MIDRVRDSYDSMAERYAALDHRIDRVPMDGERLAAFAELAGSRNGPVMDLGCGPGHVVNHLSELGVEAVGYDISPGQIAHARVAFPDLTFHLGDLAAVPVADASVGGIVARYSLIHSEPASLGCVFAEWLRMLEPGAPVLVSFFAAGTPEAHGSPFDHAVVTAYELFPATIAGQLTATGFDHIEVTKRSPLDGERALDHATILARKPAA